MFYKHVVVPSPQPTYIISISGVKRDKNQTRECKEATSQNTMWSPPTHMEAMRSHVRVEFGEQRNRDDDLREIVLS